MMKKLLFVFLIASFGANAQVNLGSSLTACYALNGTAVDAINNLNGLLSNVTPTVNRFGTPNSAFEFSGDTASFILLPENPLIEPSDAISFSCWYKTPVAHENYILFLRNSLPSYFEAYELCINGSKNFMTRKSGPQGYNMVVSTNTIVANTWYHVVFTIDNSSVKLYINGVLNGSTTSTFNGFDYVAGKKVLLGSSRESSFNGPLIGTLDNIRFYNRTISAAEVAQLYSQDPACKEETTSITTYKNEVDFSIYPNPSSGAINIDFGANIKFSYSISDILGNMLIKTEQAESDMQLDLSKYPKGIYFLQVTIDGRSGIKKIVKE